MMSKASSAASIGLSILAVLATSCTSSRTQAVNVDQEYARLVKEATTRPEFLSPLTNYLPRVAGVPTPMDTLGYIAGAPGRLTYYEDIVKYMNALAQAVPNVVAVTW